MPGADDAIVAVVNAAAPILTKPANGGSTASWITATCALLTVTLGPFLLFLVRWRGLGNKRADSIDEERRGDMDAMRRDLRELRTMCNDAVDTAREAESRSSILRAVVAMLTAEVQRISPDNPVLAQAQAMIRDASTGDMGVGRGMAEIARKVAEIE